MEGLSWLGPLVLTVLVMGFVIWRVRCFAAQDDGLAALSLWGLGFLTSIAAWAGWWVRT